ncbi:hypothetical protein HXX76_002790 [Chlamydomonas incerta]|uniref:Uncharacterized protein n=1 Tax=Chlamydomonas incerta TaxID=51695 RepID=A0A835W6U3_CHLIN|nr:hypothetical protein HXX76_002790 [Chlamydomonas incerta]|eukprot:KAG2442707.1 hypothetical protein HXX76_002790 [Chlamydomonas incerta]
MGEGGGARLWDWGFGGKRSGAAPVGGGLLGTHIDAAPQGDDSRTQQAAGFGRRQLAQSTNSTSSNTTTRYLQSNCLCNKFARPGNFTADYQYLCFTADACGGPQYTVPTAYLQSTDCNSTNTTGCEVLPAQYDSCHGWISPTSNTSVPCPTYDCCQTVQQPANVTYCASLGLYCFNVGPSPDGSTYDRFCTSSPQQTTGPG